MKIPALAGFACLCAMAQLYALTPTGTVSAVSGDVASIAIEGDAMPAVGSKAEIFFKIAGLDEEISVATGTVTGKEGALVKVKIEHASGDVAKDQLARFTAGKGDAATGSSTPAAVMPAEIIPAPTPVPSEVSSSSPGPGYIGTNLINPPAGTSGALIVEVRPQSPAEAAGLQPNDIIVALDGSPVENMQALVSATSQLAVGSRHAFLVSRAGKLQKMELTVAARPVDFGATDTTLVVPPSSLPPSVPFPSTTPAGKSNAPVASADESIAAPYVNKGLAQYSAGNIDGAIASYSEGIRAAPSVAVLYLNRANAYLYKPNFKAAIADVNKALELKVAKPEDAYTIRGTAKSGLGDYDGGIADCNRALKINPSNALAYNNRANNKLRKRDYKGALGDCNKSIALDSNSALPYYNRGFVHVNTGNLSGALADWKKAVSLQGSFGAELNPKIAQLQTQGVQPKQAASSNTPKASGPGPGDWVDLTNAPQKMVGTWQGGRHRTRYFADGTFVTDPHLVPDPPRGRWQVQGDRLVEYYPQANQTVTHQILSLDGKALVLRNPQGETFRKSRISN